MRKLHTLIALMLSIPILANAQSRPHPYEELQQSAFTFLNLPELEVFFKWLASPLVQNCCLFIMAICLFYCATAILLYALTIREVLPSEIRRLNWFAVEQAVPEILATPPTDLALTKQQINLTAPKPFFRRAYIQISTEVEVVEKLLDNQAKNQEGKGMQMI